MNGTILSKGIGIGKPFIYKKKEVVIPKDKVLNKAVDIERYDCCVKEVNTEIEALIQQTSTKNQSASSEVLSAHLLMLNDPELKSEVYRLINEDDLNVVHAVYQTKIKFMEMMLAIEDQYFQERAHDIDEVCTRVIKKLLGIVEQSLSEFSEEMIIITEELLPGETATLDIKHVKGIIMTIGGATSHSAIIANNLGIPAMVIPTIFTEAVEFGEVIILDCLENQVHLNPDATVLKNNIEKIAALKAYKEALMIYKDTEAKTIDGRKVEVLANISNEADLDLALENGAEGVGLFRTEFIYMDRSNLPSENEQFEVYKSILQKTKNKPVIIRTFDIGGDKQLDYYPLPIEENPFMGYRAIRVSLEDRNLFKTQLRAILRASVYGTCKIMFPMIASIEEVRAAKAFTHSIMLELESEGIPFDDTIKLGIMVEIPSVAVCAHLYANEVDFFSIGTNDLTQYTLAADRMNEKVAPIYNSFNPGVIQLIRHTIESGVKAGIEVGMCGEMAGERKMIPFLLSLGIHELSMSAGKILEAKKIVGHVDCDALKFLPDEIKTLTTALEIETFLENKIEEIMGKEGRQ